MQGSGTFAIEAALGSFCPKSGGKTLVVVTHDPSVAARADRVVHMRDGKVERVAFRDAAGASR